jgi:hypothetical protein
LSDVKLVHPCHDNSPSRLDHSKHPTVNSSHVTVS